MNRLLARATVALLMVLAFAAAPAVAGGEEASGSQSLRIPGGPTSASNATPLVLDADLYQPAKTPAPAVILAHGFGGSKASVVTEAKALADAGFVVLAYSARGFGATLGRISLDSPQFEVADARALIDYLSKRPEVLIDAPGDPRVGISGASYGGALALLTAGYDQRVDAVAADITWNDLHAALFPQRAEGGSGRGVFKQMWTSYFFSSGLLPTQGGDPRLCGRFTDEWCALYFEAITNGSISDAGRALMRASSPGSVAHRITAPTLLSAGLADSLFPLDQADATARQIRDAHPRTPVKVVWHGGGHDGGVPETDRLRGLLIDWFAAHLRDTGTANTDFEVTFVTGSILARRSETGPDIQRLPTYPGLLGATEESVRLTGPGQPVLAPVGGLPSGITVLPGIGSASVGVPGQYATFSSAVLEAPLTIAGSSRLRLTLTSPTPITDAVLFASLRILTPSGLQTLPAGQVAPIRLDALGPTPTTVTVLLPAIAVHADPGDILQVVVSTTDAGYRLPTQPALYFIRLASPVLTIATSELTPFDPPIAPAWWLFGALAVALLMGALVFWRKPRRRARDRDDSLSAVPLAVAGLTKQFKGGVRAVDELSFQLPVGEVIGLLGPNGAGKTTTMRMAMGLVRPTAGTVHVFGERVRPGAAVLARVGSLVEGAGFLPHLSGRQNLALYWQASGRIGQDPRFETVLAIADLGTAVDRKVRTYSQGMRQRLGIAQAMLGMPDLLLLDEPTNGLDPQQIRAMREVLHEYAATGRTVIVSSHMLSEVEQTCSYVVVMHRGGLVTAGAVTDLLTGRGDMRLEDFFLGVIGDDLTVGNT